MLAAIQEIRRKNRDRVGIFFIRDPIVQLSTTVKTQAPLEIPNATLQWAQPSADARRTGTRGRRQWPEGGARNLLVLRVTKRVGSGFIFQ